MNLFSVLFSRAPKGLILTILLDALSGIAYATMIPLVLESIGTRDDGARAINVQPVTILPAEVAHQQYALMFTAVVAFILVTKAVSRILMERIALNVTAELRITLYGQLLRAPVAAVERAGPGRTMAVLAEDVPRIVSAGRLFPRMLSNIATLTGMLGYLAFLNAHVFWFVLQAVIAGAVTYQVPLYIALRFLRRRRELVDKLHQSIRALLDGFKELKLDQRKRSAFLGGYLLENENAVRNTGKAGDAILVFAGVYGDLLNFFVIGVVAFVFVNYHTISNQELIAVIMTLLYITAPIAALLDSAPQYVSSRVSLQKVNQLFKDMPAEQAQAVYEPAVPWSSIRFEDVVYSYESAADRRGYVVGPVSFEIARGEVTFIAGGNGSGKSTLGKLITLHYAAQSGEIYFGNTRISGDTLNVCRQSIACIYSDYYLFDRLLGQSEEGVADEVDRYLRELGLEQKVSFANGKFSSVHLSDGQKRRLALLVAFVENKDLYLFDEWAADQDPHFKEVFYHEILPGLKRKGKAVVVVSHDDRYFHIADKLLYMENGRLIKNPEKGFLKRTPLPTSTARETADDANNAPGEDPSSDSDARLFTLRGIVRH